MTALLVGTFVVENKITWDTPVLSFFPELAPQVADSVRNITIGQVLNHSAGLPEANTTEFWDKWPKTGSVSQQRRELARWALLHPQFPCGTYHYSNANYVLIAAILEKVSGRSWEELHARAYFWTPQDGERRFRRNRNARPRRSTLAASGLG